MKSMKLWHNKDDTVKEELLFIIKIQSTCFLIY